MSKNEEKVISNLSKAWIENALFKLMRTKDYPEITVTEITVEAGLSKRTFYKNYFSKDDVLESYFAKIWHEYETRLREETDLTLPNIAGIFFTLIQKYFDFFALLNSHHLFPHFLAMFDDLLQPAFNESAVGKMPFSAESIEYALTFSAGGLLHVLIRWLNGKERKSPEEMAVMVRDITAIFNYSNP